MGAVLSLPHVLDCGEPVSIFATDVAEVEHVERDDQVAEVIHGKQHVFGKPLPLFLDPLIHPVQVGRDQTQPAAHHNDEEPIHVGVVERLAGLRTRCVSGGNQDSG